MAQVASELMQMKGVGTVMAQRLSDAGFDSVKKIAQASEEELKKVRGITPQAMRSIVEQATKLAQQPEAGHPEAGEAVRKHLSEVREKVHALARVARDRFHDDLTGKSGKKLSTDLTRIEDALAKMDTGGRKRSKRAGKALIKAEKRVTGLEDASLKKIRKSIKRAKKVMLKALKRKSKAA
jgi:ribosomal protein S13